MVQLGPHHFLCHANLLLGTCTEAIADKGSGKLRVGQQWPRLALFIASKLSNPAMDVPEIPHQPNVCNFGKNFFKDHCIIVLRTKSYLRFYI